MHKSLTELGMKNLDLSNKTLQRGAEALFSSLCSFPEGKRFLSGSANPITTLLIQLQGRALSGTLEILPVHIQRHSGPIGQLDGLCRTLVIR